MDLDTDIVMASPPASPSLATTSQTSATNLTAANVSQVNDSYLSIPSQYFQGYSDIAMLDTPVASGASTPLSAKDVPILSTDSVRHSFLDSLETAFLNIAAAASTVTGDAPAAVAPWLWETSEMEIVRRFRVGLERRMGGLKKDSISEEKDGKMQVDIAPAVDRIKGELSVLRKTLRNLNEGVLRMDSETSKAVERALGVADTFSASLTEKMAQKTSTPSTSTTVPATLSVKPMLMHAGRKRTVADRASVDLGRADREKVVRMEAARI